MMLCEWMVLVFGFAVMECASAAEAGKVISGEVDFNTPNGQIRRLNGGNIGPNLMGAEFHMTEAREFADLEIPMIRLHDVPLAEAGARIVDVQMIFGNMNSDPQDPANYFFAPTDDYLSQLRSCGSEIFYRLGPRIEHSLQSYECRPPKDFNKWADVCIGIIRHYNEGWGNGFHWNIKYWEIWNEADIGKSMWDGPYSEYLRFYEVVAKKIKARFPDIKLGGPAFCGFQPGTPTGEARGKEFLSYCRDHQVPVDFVSWHNYPSELKGIIAQPAAVRQYVDRFGFTQAELFLNEWHWWIGGLDRRGNEDPTIGLNSANGAIFATAVLTGWQDSPLTMGGYYTVGPLADCWGAWDSYGARNKLFYTFRAFAKLCHYSKRVKSQSSDISVQILAGRNAEGRRAVLVSAFRPEAQTLQLTLKGAEKTEFVTTRVDLDNNWKQDRVTTGPAGEWVLPGPAKGQSCLVLLREAEEKPQTYVLFGDLLTVAQTEKPENSWAKLFAKELGANVRFIEAAAEGRSLGEAMADYQKIILETKPNAVFLGFGSIRAKFQDEASFKADLDKFKAGLPKGCKVVAMTFPKVHEKLHGRVPPEVNQYLNERLPLFLSYAMKNNWAVIKTYGLSTEEQIASDGIHLNPRGQKALLECIKPLFEF